MDRTTAGALPLHPRGTANDLVIADLALTGLAPDALVFGTAPSDMNDAGWIDLGAEIPDPICVGQVPETARPAGPMRAALWPEL